MSPRMRGRNANGGGLRSSVVQAVPPGASSRLIGPVASKFHEPPHPVSVEMTGKTRFKRFDNKVSRVVGVAMLPCPPRRGVDMEPVRRSWHEQRMPSGTHHDPPHR